MNFNDVIYVCGGTHAHMSHQWGFIYQHLKDKTYNIRRDKHTLIAKLSPKQFTSAELGNNQEYTILLLLVYSQKKTNHLEKNAAIIQ